jgi:hypothetical protein
VDASHGSKPHRTRSTLTSAETTPYNSTPVPAPSDRTAARLSTAVFLISGAVLLLEIVYTRLFSFAIWYHFAYAMIGVALLGFGASGALVAVRPRLLTAPGLPGRIALVAALGAVGTVGGLGIVGAVPFDPFYILRSPVQLLYFSIYLLAVLVPFFCAGLAIALILSARPDRVGLLYCWDLCGAALGALAAMPLLAWVGAPRAVVCAALLLVAASFVLRGVSLVGALGAVVVVAGLAFAAHLAPRAAPSKNLMSLLGDPTARVIFSGWNPVARIDLVDWEDPERSREKGCWSIWGRSERDDTPSPPQRTITQDAGAVTPMYQFHGDFDELKFLDSHILRTPYVPKRAERVLVIGLGGGIDVLTALKYGAAHVTAVDINPVTTSLLTDRYADWQARLFQDRSRVDVRMAEGRHFARQSDARFDVIQINGVDTLAALSSGAYVLAESYLYTVEAMQDLWARLSPDGLLSMIIEDDTAHDWPPRHALRLFGVMVEALERLGVADPAAHLAIVGAPERSNVTRLVSAFMPEHRAVMSIDLLLKRSPFTPAERAALAEFAGRTGFLLLHGGPGGTQPPFSGAIAPRPAREAFFDGFPLAVRPTTDDQPFFFSFYRWRDLIRQPELGQSRASATGQFVLLVMLAGAVLGSLVLVLGPLASFDRAGVRVPGAPAYALYFSCLGLGFMFLEVPLIQRFVLFLGYPTRAFSVTLAGLLVFAGIGSLASTRLAARGGAAVLGLAAVLIAMTAAYVQALPIVFAAFLEAGDATRIAVTLVLLAPLGLVLGAFFPLGVRCLPDARFVPWAWGINGVTSVVGSVLAIVLGITYGFTVVMTLALGLYGVGAVTLAAVVGLGPRRAAEASSTTTVPIG